MTVFDELKARGLVAQLTDEEEIKELIKNLKKVNPFVESNIFRSVENVNIDTVVGYKQHGIRHNFLEGYDDNPGYVPEAEKAAAETEQEKEGK